MQLYKKLYEENKFLLTLGLLFGFLAATTGIVLIDSINNAISSAPLLIDQKVTKLFLLCLALFIFVVSSHILFMRIGNKVICNLRIEMSRRLLNTPLEVIHNIGKPKIIAAFANDINDIAQAFMALPSVVFGLFIVSGGLGYLAWLSLPFFCVLLFSLIIIVLGLSVLMKKIAINIKLSRNADDRVYRSFQAVIDGNSALKMNNHRLFSFDQYDLTPPIEEVKTHANRAAVYFGLTEGWVDAMTLATISSVIAVFFVLDIGTSQQLTAFALAVLFLRAPVSNIINSIGQLIRGDVAINKIAELELSELTDQPANPASFTEPEPWKSLTIENVQYDYPGNGGELGFSLGPINLQLKKGELLFIVGGNGSGKSTFAQLLTGLYKPSLGTIKLDERAIDENSLNAYRQNFAVVLSDFFLFERLLDSNGKTPSLNQVSKYLQLFKLDKKIKVTDGILNTIDLSQGQKKRLALISAFLEDKPILVLDEWAADQDPSFRKVFYTELLPDLCRRGKTIIAITHDDHYFSMADRVMKIEDGRLAPLVSTQP